MPSCRAPGISLGEHRGDSPGKKFSVGIDTVLGTAASRVSVQVDQPRQQHRVGEIECLFSGGFRGWVHGRDQSVGDADRAGSISARLWTDDTASANQEVERGGVVHQMRNLKVRRYQR
ncbi:MAG: hypothetical protein Ct9H300mP1_09940 [Planctomycetaceae bacterium]|nr:MAG: hypothetical protein Ct9H300mP1_09940 [Planctomycetaceae bacterium]